MHVNQMDSNRDKRNCILCYYCYNRFFIFQLQAEQTFNTSSIEHGNIIYNPTSTPWHESTSVHIQTSSAFNFRLINKQPNDYYEKKKFEKMIIVTTLTYIDSKSTAFSSNLLNKSKYI